MRINTAKALAEKNRGKWGEMELIEDIGEG